MKHTASNLIQRLVGMMVVLTLVVSTTAISAHAASSAGIYTATASAHYRNPSTGEIEDSGGEESEVLGQSMTESALYTKALVEIDKDGNSWVTVRLKLADSISNVSFGRSATLMQEDYGSNTADYRMKAKAGSTLRCSMYVTPMGREVIWYITISSSLSAGSGDFVVTLTDADIASSDSGSTGDSGTTTTAANGGAGSTKGEANTPAVAAPDKTALAEAITADAALVETDYTADSWTAFAAALTAAQGVNDQADATQEGVDAALAALNDAAAALVKLADKSALTAAIEQVSALQEADYTAASWQTLSDALTAAQTVADKEDATQEEVDAALSPLYDAMGALVELADKTALAAAIDSASALNEKDYTADSWAAVSDALATAQSLNEQEDAAQKDVDNAAQTLNDAVGALVEKTVSPVVIVVIVVMVLAAAGAVTGVVLKKKKAAK